VESPKTLEKSHKVEEKTLYVAPKQISQKHDEKKESTSKPTHAEVSDPSKIETAVRKDVKQE